MSEIAAEIASEYSNDLNVEVTDDNAENLVVRVRINSETPQGMDEHGNAHDDDAEVGQGDDVFLKQLEKNMMEKLKLRGVDYVKKVFMRDGGKRTIWDDNTGFYLKDEWILETGQFVLSVLYLVKPLK
jgi:DNA-directed RNA polymerase II subunit RPB1